MKGLTPNEQRDLFEFLAFNVLERTVRRYEKVRNLFSAVKKKLELLLIESFLNLKLFETDFTFLQ